jgi:hypothetical protein
MVEPALIASTAALLFLLQACVVSLSFKKPRSARFRTIVLLSCCALVILWTGIEARSSFVRTNQATNIILLTVGWVFFYELAVLSILFTFWYLYGKIVSRWGARGCRRCGMENVPGSLFCRNCRTFAPQSRAVFAVVALLLLGAIIAKIGHMAFLLAFRDVAL